MSKTTDFNNLHFFKEEIEPLLNEIIIKCRRQNIPCITSFCVSGNEGKNSKYISRVVSPCIANTEISPDYISECIKIFNGYKASLHSAPLIDINDIMQQINIESGDEYMPPTYE